MLQKHFHFDCLCPRCMKEEADPPTWLAELAVFKHSVAATLQVISSCIGSGKGILLEARSLNANLLELI